MVDEEVSRKASGPARCPVWLEAEVLEKLSGGLSGTWADVGSGRRRVKSLESNPGVKRPGSGLSFMRDLRRLLSPFLLL